MPIYEFSSTGVSQLKETQFGLAGLHERRDLQRLLRENVAVIAPETLVISEEFGDWDDSRRRIDLLALDKTANVVVIELKRTDDGGHMDLQAIRYASMVSTMTFDQAVDAFAQYLKKVGRDEQDSREAILDFLGWEEPDDDLFAQDVRIVLASAEFSKEITSSVLWLIDQGIDIRCVRLKPYSLEDRLLVDVQQIIPLPEAADYQFQVREKAQKERQARVSNADFTRFDVAVDGVTHHSMWKRNAIYLVCKRLSESGVNPDAIGALFTWRTNAFWIEEGTVDGAEFEKLAGDRASMAGRGFEPPRWFCDDAELFHANGKTYALSKRWGGKNWHRAMSLLKERFPEHRIDFTPTA